MTEKKDLHDISNQLPDAGEIGSVRITDEVVSIIAGLAAAEVSGVAGMSGGLAGGIAELLGKKNMSKGVKANIKENKVSIDLYVIMDYGVCIPDVAIKMQEKVKEAVETMTSMEVVEINIHIQGVTHIENVKEEVVNALVE